MWHCGVARNEAVFNVRAGEVSSFFSFFFFFFFFFVGCFVGVGNAGSRGMLGDDRFVTSEGLGLIAIL